MEEFERKLEAPPRTLPQLHKLLKEPSVLDAQDAVRKAAEEAGLD